MAAQNQIDPIVTWVVLLAMLAGGLFGMWVINYKQLGPAIIAVKKYEVYPFALVSKSAQVSYKRLELMQMQSKRAAQESENINYGTMWQMVSIAAREAGQYYRKPIGLILIGMALWIMFTSKQGSFKSRHSLESLMRVQSISWPNITPFLTYNPAKNENQRAPGSRVPLSLPLFAEALYPEEWMAMHRIRVVNGVPDRDQIRRELMSQLGDRFDGIDNLPVHLYCLLAAFAMKGGRKRKESDAFLGELSTCWSDEKGFVPSASVRSTSARILNDKKFVGPLLDVMNRHAYVATALLGALAWARSQGGVLAPAQFVWLRGEDREIWYPLNNLGRRSFHVEAAGAMAHYQSELEAHRALTMPRLDSAVVAIVQYMSESRARIPEIEGGGKDDVKSLPPGRRDPLLLAKPAKT